MASLTEPFASGDSFLHGMDPRIRLLAALVLTVPVAVLPELRPAWLALAAGLVLVKMARLNMLVVLNRLMVVNLFIVFLWFFLPFSVPGEPVFDLGPLHATAQGIDRALLITVKSNAIVVSLMALLGTISIQNLGPALQQLGVPDKLCHILLFTHRYIFSIYQEYTTMRQAMRARGFMPRTDTHTYRTVAWLVGMLLVKSWDRAERVHGAMLCRGFRGRFYSLTAFKTRPADYLFLLACAALSAGLIYMAFIQGETAVSHAVIELSDITYAFPGREETLKGLTFHLHPGEKLGLFGPNGAGKSTMLHILMGLLTPDKGEVTLFGAPMSDAKAFEAARLKIGFLFQNSDDQLFCPTVLDDVAFGPLNQGLDRDEAAGRARQALSTVGLAGFEDRVPHRLSGGEKKLVAPATILSMRPEVLVLDEPTTGLSPEAKDRLVDILKGLDMARLVVSHDPDFLAATTDRLLAMRDGRIKPGELKPHSHVHVHEEGDVPHQH